MDGRLHLVDTRRWDLQPSQQLLRLALTHSANTRLKLAVNAGFAPSRSAAHNRIDVILDPDQHPCSSSHHKTVARPSTVQHGQVSAFSILKDSFRATAMSQKGRSRAAGAESAPIGQREPFDGIAKTS